MLKTVLLIIICFGNHDDFFQDSDLKFQNIKTLFPVLNLILGPRFPVLSRTFGPYRIINIQQFLQSTATSQHCHFSNHHLHCSEMKAICWPFLSWTHSLKHTQTCILVSHTEWNSLGTQRHSTIQQFNSEHKSFQHSDVLSLTICVANTVSYAAVSYTLTLHLTIWKLVTSNADAHTNKPQTLVV